MSSIWRICTVRRRILTTPPLGHESMERLVPGLADVARAVAASMRCRYGADEIERVLSSEELATDLGIQRFH